MLERWRERDVFHRSLAQREGAEIWSFYEGPPTANGRPGSHHVFSRVFKDVYPRYKAMCGYRVPRKAGWDCHGLPVELEVEKQLGISSKQEIEDFGIAEFNARCRESVFEYVEEWNRLTERIGFWVDLDDPYVTLDDSYIESVWWSLKRLWDEGRLYEGHKVVPYCPRCGTALSSHEVALGYEDVEDPSIYVRFPLLGEDGSESGESLLVWTTTPWTLPGNVAVAAAPGVTYVKARAGEETLIVAEPLLEKVLGEDVDVLGRVSGAELVGRRYRGPVFELGDREPGGFPVLAGDFVTTEDGTGLVHIAPAFGEDDYRVAAENEIFDPTSHGTLYNPVGLDGKFDGRVTGFEGKFVKDPEVTRALIEDLDRRGLLFREQVYEHAYPHCWRCGTPLLYYAKSSWYIATSQVRDRLLANNETIGWHPEHIKARALRQVARGQRRLGALARPLLGHAAADLGVHGRGLRRPLLRRLGGGAARAGKGRGAGGPAPPLHRRGDSRLRRVRGRDAPGRVGDRHLVRQRRDALRAVPLPVRERGALRAALPRRLHLRGDRPDARLVLHPARRVDAPLRHLQLPQLRLPRPHPRPRGPEDVEEQGQRGRALGGDLRPRRRRLPLVLPDRAAALVGLPLLGRHGRRIGAPVPPHPLEHVLLLGPLRQRREPRRPADFGSAARARAEDLDRWALSRLQSTIATVRERMDEFDCTTAGRAIAEYVEELSNWYVRLSRRRFWEGDRAAFATLRHCLLETAALLAPFTPFLADEIHLNLAGGEGEELGGLADSVHLRDFPRARPGARRPRARGGDGGGAPHRRARPRRPRPGQGEGAPAAAPRRDRRQRRRARGDRGSRRRWSPPSSTSRSSTSSPRRPTWSATRSSPTTARSARASASACRRSPLRSRRSTRSTSPG